MLDACSNAQYSMQSSILMVEAQFNSSCICSTKLGFHSFINHKIGKDEKDGEGDDT